MSPRKFDKEKLSMTTNLVIYFVSIFWYKHDKVLLYLNNIRILYK